MSGSDDRVGARRMSPALSRAAVLLCGTGTHDAVSGLPDVPAVATTLGDIQQVLIDRCGVRSDAVSVLLDPDNPMAFGAGLAEAVERARDVLLIYYVGHGLVSPHGSLYLATRSSRQQPLAIEHTAFSYDTLRRYVLESRARSVVVILDCCFSGKALAGLNASQQLAALTDVTGAFVLTSAGQEEVALAPVGRRHTAFSGALIDLLTDGDADGPPELTLHHAYRYLSRVLPATGYPRPQCRASGKVGDLVLTRNPAEPRPAPDPPAERPRRRWVNRATAAWAGSATVAAAIGSVSAFGIPQAARGWAYLVAVSVVVGIVVGVVIGGLLGHVLPSLSGPWSRRRVLSTGLAAVLALLPAAGGGYLGLRAFAATQAHFGDSLEPGDLVILAGSDEGVGAPRQELIDRWNRSHPFNKANVIVLPPGVDARHASMVATVRDGGIDVVELEVTWIAEFAGAGFLRPLDGALATTEGFLPPVMRTCDDGVKRWCVPYTADVGLLFYNTAMVPDVSTKPLGSTTQIDAATEVISASEGLTAGFAMQLGTPESATITALEAIWEAGGRILDDHNRVAFDDKARQALKRLAQRLRPSHPQLVDPQSLTYGDRSSLAAFQEGKVAFVRSWPTTHRLLPTDVKFGVTPLPGPSVLGGRNLAVAAGTGKPRAAAALIDFLTGPDSQRFQFDRAGVAPTRTALYYDRAIVARHPYITTVLKAVVTADTRPLSPHYVRFSEVFGSILRRALTGSGEIGPADEQALNDALSRG